MKNNEFLKEYLLEVVVFKDELKQVRSILKEANEHFVLLHKEKKDDSEAFGERYIFKVNCPTTNFAMAYFYLGRQMHTILSNRKLKDTLKNNKN